MIVAVCNAHRLRLVCPDRDALAVFYQEHAKCHVDVSWDGNNPDEVAEVEAAAAAFKRER